jgi:hypothetical protein
MRRAGGKLYGKAALTVSEKMPGSIHADLPFLHQKRKTPIGGRHFLTVSRSMSGSPAMLLSSK